MAQLERLTSLRAALETTRGTGVNPTRILEQTSFDTDLTLGIIRPSERRGLYEDVFTSAVDREENAFTFEGLLTYQQMVWFGNMFFAPLASGTGAGADKTWTFTPSMSADNVKSATFEWAYDTPSAGQPGRRLVYGLGSALELNFDRENAEGITFSCTIESPKATTDISAFGGTPTSVTSNLLTNPSIFVYIDPTTIGTTLDQNVTAVTFNLTFDLTALLTFNQSTSAADTFKIARDWSATITRYPADNTEWAAWKAGTLRKVRVRSTGPVLGSSNHAVTLDLNGVYTDYDEPAVGGVMRQQFTLAKKSDGTNPSYSGIVVTDTAAIT